MVKQGSMLAIMGSSGAGKTTLLNALAGRVRNCSGDIMINKEAITKQDRRHMGYALQQDVFFTNLTLRQTLKFTAMLRLPDSVPPEVKTQRCDVIIKKLGLEQCLDTPMGGVFEAGLSGGERKRANIACELLSDPMLMLIDEPTSGLDAALAFQIMATLGSYATEENKTIVTTIHQPSSQIFHMFQNVLLLADGQVAYYGHSRDVLPFFTARGLHCDHGFNPADFILDQVTRDIETRKLLVDATNKVRCTDAWPDDLRSDLERPALTSKVRDTQPKWPTSFWSQFKTLVQRNFVQKAKSTLGGPDTFFCIAYSIACMISFWQLPREEEYILIRERLIFFSSIMLAVAPVPHVVNSFPAERAVIDKERLAGAYRLSAYYLAKMASELPVVLVFPTLYIIMTYFCTGMTLTPAHFFAVLGIAYSLAVAAQGVGFVIGSSFLDLRVASMITMQTFHLNLFAAGALQKNLRPFMRWVRYVPLSSYGVDMLLHAEFTYGHPFSCSGGNVSRFPECVENSTVVLSGQRALEASHDTFPVWLDAAYMVGIIVLLRIVGYLILRYPRHPSRQHLDLCPVPRLQCCGSTWRAAAAGRGASLEGEHGPGHNIRRKFCPGLRFNLTFKNVSATLSGKQVLKNVSGHVSSGTMLAVLGPSGTGKTTLLNVLTGRVAPSGGEMTVNTYPINKHIRRKIGYVMQQDVFFNKLTLRQTLQFTVQLRLPEKMTWREKQERIDEIVDQFNLRKCLNTKISLLSGGEKKRANIACELLADPALLLVDEPTTGLDAALAFQMVTTLQGYASTANKTIVATIHQPASHVFHMFEKILLMAEGQVAYYGDPEGVVAHFSSLGLHCQPNYNPADFILEQLRVGTDVTDKIIAAGREMRNDREAGENKNESVAMVNGKNEAVENGSMKIRNSTKNGYLTNVSTLTGSSRNGSVKTESEKNGVLIHESATIGSLYGESDVVVYGSDGNKVKFLSYRKRDPDLADTVVHLETIADSKHIEEEERTFLESNKWPTHFWTQYKTLAYRNLMESLTRALDITVLVTEMGTAILMGLVWWQQPLEERTIEDYKGMATFLMAHAVFVSMIDILASYQAEKIIVRKERLSGTYRLSAYWLAKMTSEVPSAFLFAVLQWCILYFMIGLPPSAWIFLSSLLVVVLSAIIAQSLGFFVAALIDDFKTGFYVLLTQFLVTYITGGFISPPSAWTSWLQYLSNIAWTYQIFLEIVVGHGPDWRCADSSVTIFSRCKHGGGNLTEDGASYVSGRTVLNVTEKNTFPMWQNITACFLLIFVLSISTYFVLRYIKNPTKKGKNKN